MAAAAPKVVGYFTDVEGNWEFFQRCLAFSSVLQVPLLAPPNSVV